MNAYQKSSVLVLRFAALGLIVYGLVQFAQWFVLYSTLIGGSTTFARFFSEIQLVSLPLLRAQVAVSAVSVVCGFILMLLSKPMGRLLGRGLEA